MKQSIKILLLTDEMNPGGVSRHVVDLANGLEERGITPIVAATDGPFRNRLHQKIPFVNLSLFLPNSNRKSLVGFLSAYRILKKIIHSENVGLIHTHKRYTDVLGRILARRMSLHHISTCHNVFTSLRPVSVFGDITIACSKAVEEILIKDFGKEPKTIRRVYYGIAPFREYGVNEKNQVSKNLLIPGKNKIIASVGQFIESKDRTTLIRAIGILKKMDLIGNVLFVIMGEGEQEAKLKERVRFEGIQNDVLFLNGIFNVEVLFNVADFIVLSSIREGLPYVILEAASVGKPHIATDVGGVSEFVINGETGVLVPPRNPERLAEAIKDLLNNPQKVEKLGKKAREKYIQQFTYDRFIDETIEVYNAYGANRSQTV